VDEMGGDPGTVWQLQVSIEPGFQLYVAGEFTHFGDVPRHGIARLYPNGAPDPKFDPGLGADGPIYAVTMQPDGKIIIVGAFQHFGEVARNGIARLNPDGSVDGTFDPGDGANDAIYAA